MAANDGYLDDENRDTPDWIELRNPNSFPVSAAGYRLRDSGNLWTIPDGTTIAAGGHLRIFASGKDRRDPSRNLHTNFSLSADGIPRQPNPGNRQQRRRSARTAHRISPHGPDR
jgi:hypothetical protein